MPDDNDTTSAQPAACVLDRPVRPLVWARKDQLQHASTRGGLMCAMYPNTDRRADLQPLYDQAALNAAVAEAKRMQAADTELLRRALHTLVWGVGSDGLFATQTADVLKALRARLGA